MSEPNKPPTIYFEEGLRNHCPHCNARIRDYHGPRPEGQVMIGICGMCGHLLVLSFEGSDILESKLTRKAVDEFSIENKKMAHDAQERMHHKLGQWG